jgi:uncharacterized protein (DUF305 family)
MSAPRASVTPAEPPVLGGATYRPRNAAFPLPCAAMRTRQRLRAPVVAALAALVTLAGCGGDDDKSSSPEVRANGTDAAFVDEMIPHHEQAVDAADIGLSRTEHRQLRNLAEEIVQLQSVELATLRSVRDVLQNADVEPDELGLDQSELGIHHDPAGLRDASDFDCAFLELMIPHHEGAIRLARAELQSGIHAELRRMSQDIIDEQGFELRQMERFQRRWCS